MQHRDHLRLQIRNHKTVMNATENEALLRVLQARFEQHMNRHPGIAWAAVRARLLDDPVALRVIAAMEVSSGEPDVIGQDSATGQYIYCDCSAESPAGRRSLCFDGAALASRKEHKARSSAAEMAAQIGISLLTEQQYRELQTLGEFDRKTSSWVDTPTDVRELGGALFCDRRYGRVFTYHNGAESYYAVRGFRGSIRV